MTANPPDTNTAIQRLPGKLLPVFTGRLLPTLFLTIIMILFSRKLSYTAYGQFQTCWIYVNILSVAISFGIHSVLLSTELNYFSQFIDRNQKKITGLYLGGAIVVFSIFYITTQQLPPATKALLVVFILLQCTCSLTDTLLIKQQQLRTYVWVNIGYASLFFSIHLYFYFQPFVLNALLVAVIALSACKGLLLVKLVQALPTAIPAKHSRQLPGNWLYIGINDILGIVARWLDKLFLIYLLSAADFAVFFNGAIEIPLFGILISAMEYIMLTHISANITNRLAATVIFKESFKLLSLVAFPLFFLLLTMHREAFAIIFNHRYDASIPVFLVSIFIIPVRITHYGVLLQCYGQSRKIAIGSLFDLVFSLLLMIVLYPVMGTPGVALALVSCTYLQAAFYTWQSAKLMQTPIGALVPVTFLVRLLGALVVIYGCLFYLKQFVDTRTAFISAFLITVIIVCGGTILYLRKNASLVTTPTAQS